VSATRALTEAEIHPLIAGRWSPRAFDSGRPIERDKLISCLEAARWAPSAFGDEPWRFIVCDRHENDSAWQRLLNCLSEKNRRWAKHAPVLILIVADSLFRKNGNPNRWGQYDAGQAAVSLCLQAAAMGLATHQMGSFDIEGCRQTFAIPEQFMPMAAMALGYAADASLLDDDFRPSEETERRRQALNRIAFAGQWDTGLVKPDIRRPWEEQYRDDEVESMPWFYPHLDVDVAAALEWLDIHSGKALDIGSGPGTQAIELARRGFDTTGSDISPSAVTKAAGRAENEGVSVRFVHDDVLDSRLTGPFDLIMDRGCFHAIDAGARPVYLQAVHRLLADGGHLLLKTFHKEERRKEGPSNRFEAEDIKSIFADYFELVYYRDSFFESTMDSNPKALFCILKKIRGV